MTEEALVKPLKLNKIELMKPSIFTLFSFIVFISIVSLAAAVFVGKTQAYAQEGGEDFFDPEEEYYEDEYVEEDAPETADGEAGAGGVRGSKNRPNANKPTFDTSGLNMPGANNSYNSENIEFKLVNPPKYWKPKKRKLTKPPANR